MGKTVTFTVGDKPQGIINKQATEKDINKEYIQLKEGQSINVRFLKTDDIVEYMSHSSQLLGIDITPCIAPHGEDCPLCVAAKSSDDVLKKELRKVSRYLLAIADLDNGKLRLLDATKEQTRKIVMKIYEHADELDKIAFILKRTKNCKDMDYSLNVMKSKMFNDVEKVFRKFDDVVAGIPFYEERLIDIGAPEMVHWLERWVFVVFITHIIRFSKSFKNFLYNV